MHYLGAGGDAGGTDPGARRGPGKSLAAHRKEVSGWEGREGPQELYTLSPSTLRDGCCRHRCATLSHTQL